MTSRLCFGSGISVIVAMLVKVSLNTSREPLIHMDEARPGCRSNCSLDWPAEAERRANGKLKTNRQNTRTKNNTRRWNGMRGSQGDNSALCRSGLGGRRGSRRRSGGGRVECFPRVEQSNDAGSGNEQADPGEVTRVREKIGHAGGGGRYLHLVHDGAHVFRIVRRKKCNQAVGDVEKLKAYRYGKTPAPQAEKSCACRGDEEKLSEE